MGRRILMVASEYAPFAKTGGLGDVIGGLCNALSDFGHQVQVFMPYYREIRLQNPPVQAVGAPLEITLGEKTYQGKVLEHAVNENLKLWLLDCPELYDRDGLYGDPETGRDFEDNAQRFGFFGRAALEFCKSIRFRPQVIHGHDWQGGLPLALLPFETDSVFNRTVSIFTIHNLAYQGLFPEDNLVDFGLEKSTFTEDGVKFFGKVSLLKAGLTSASIITTVSEKYALEIQTEELGFGMTETILANAHKLFGVLNGIDVNVWNPETDPCIASNYSADDLSGKADCKKDLLETFNLPGYLHSVPLFGTVARLVEQKGLDLVAQIAQDIIAHGGSLVVLGKGDPKIENQLREIQKQFPERIAVRLEYSEELAHKIEAGCDFFLMPSRFEPCGLNQMYSLRYATAPIVRATGGLDDSVKEFYPKSGNGNGFKFQDSTPEALLKAVMKAADIFEQPNLMETLRQNCMKEDFSWGRSARKYVMLYNKTIKGQIGQDEDPSDEDDIDEVDED